MSRVGLVLGGGGITGASYHFGALFALRLATGWDPNDAEVIIGTSCGGVVAAMIRGESLDLETLVGDAHTRHDVADRLRGMIFRRRTLPRGVVRWLRKGVIPGIRRPDLNLALGSPGLYSTSGIAEWIEDSVGGLADKWPEAPTVIVGYDLNTRRRVPFGTEAAPDVALKDAVAASMAVPFIFEPVKIDDRWYADGGIASGTSADLILASPTPLDLLIIIAPMAASESRQGSRFYEDLFDRAGRAALAGELEQIRDLWPETDILVLRPDERVLEATRPNPFSVEAAIPAFLRTLRSLRDELGHPDTWDLLDRHLVGTVRSN